MISDPAVITVELFVLSIPLQDEKHLVSLYVCIKGKIPVCFSYNSNPSFHKEGFFPLPINSDPVIRTEPPVHNLFCRFLSLHITRSNLHAHRGLKGRSWGVCLGGLTNRDSPDRDTPLHVIMMMRTMNCDMWNTEGCFSCNQLICEKNWFVFL